MILSIPTLSIYQQGWVGTAVAVVFQRGVDASKSFKVIELLPIDGNKVF